jgi:hypothetical protein
LLNAFCAILRSVRLSFLFDELCSLYTYTDCSRQVDTIGAVVALALKNRTWCVLEDYSAEDTAAFDLLLHTALAASAQARLQYEAAKQEVLTSAHLISHSLEHTR